MLTNETIVIQSPFSNEPNSINIPYLHIRDGTADRGTYRDVVTWPNHLPPEDEKWRDPEIQKTILDCGSHIGCTVLHYLSRYPNLLIHAYEPNRANYMVLDQNTKNHPQYAVIYNAAIGPQANHNRIVHSPLGDAIATNSYSYRTPVETAYDNMSSVIGINFAIDNLRMMRPYGYPEVDTIDYLKMDIEGAENEVFFGEEPIWLWKVQAINIELHYEAALRATDIRKILHKHDMDVLPSILHPNCLVGYRWS